MHSHNGLLLQKHTLDATHKTDTYHRRT